MEKQDCFFYGNNNDCAKPATKKFMLDAGSAVFYCTEHYPVACKFIIKEAVKGI